MTLLKVMLRPRRSMGQLQGQVNMQQKELLMTRKAQLKAEMDVLTVIDFVTQLCDEQSQHLERARKYLLDHDWPSAIVYLSHWRQSLDSFI